LTNLLVEEISAPIRRFGIVLDHVGASAASQTSFGKSSDRPIANFCRVYPHIGSQIDLQER